MLRRDDVGIAPYKSHRIKFAPWRTIIVNCQLYIVNYPGHRPLHIPSNQIGSY